MCTLCCHSRRIARRSVSTPTTTIRIHQALYSQSARFRKSWHQAFESAGSRRLRDASKRSINRKLGNNFKVCQWFYCLRYSSGHLISGGNISTYASSIVSSLIELGLAQQQLKTYLSTFKVNTIDYIVNYHHICIWEIHVIGSYGHRMQIFAREHAKWLLVHCADWRILHLAPITMLLWCRKILQNDPWQI